MNIEPGTLLKDVYRIEKLVFASPYRRVYWALQKRLRLAVDVLFESTPFPGDITPRAHRSISLMQRIRHPNVVALLDHWIEEERREAVYVTEFVGGETLAHHRLRRGTLPWTEVAFVMDGVLRALEAIHTAQLVHRNVEPKSIMLCATRAPVVRLSGMRLLKSLAEDRNLGRVTQRGRTLPHSPYQSPEVLLAKEAGPASDLYALSVVAYELLCGYLPGEVDGQRKLSERLQNPPPPPTVPPGMPPVPPAFISLLLGGLAPSPQDRPESARTFRKAIADFADSGFSADQVVGQTDRNQAARLNVRSQTGRRSHEGGFRGSALVAAICPSRRVLSGDGSVMERLAGEDSVTFDLGIRFSLALIGTGAGTPAGAITKRVEDIRNGLIEAFGEEVPFMATHVDTSFVLPKRFLDGLQAPPKRVLELLDALTAAYPDSDS